MAPLANDECALSAHARARAFTTRWLLAYFVLYALPFPLSLVPGPDLDDAWRELTAPLVVAFGERVFGLSVPALPNGSGDTTYNHVEIVLFALSATLIAGTWTLRARDTSAERARALLRVQLRFVLAIAMLAYGWAKVLPLQFGPPSPDRLLGAVGETSPMGLLWTLMGSSRAYCVFAGALEVVAGLLLLGARTATLGALVSCAVMANVVALNVCFDVPVKLYSAHLFVMGALVAWPDARRIALAIGLGAAVPAAEHGELATTTRGRRRVFAVKVLAVAALVWGQVSELRAELTIDDAGAAPSIAGMWVVERIERGGADVPLLVSDARLLRRVFVAPWSTVTLRHMDDTTERYAGDFDEERRHAELHVVGARDAAPRGFTWERLDQQHLRVRWEDRAETVELRRADERAFLLTSRGFRWVQEEPFNR